MFLHSACFELSRHIIPDLEPAWASPLVRPPSPPPALDPDPGTGYPHSNIIYSIHIQTCCQNNISISYQHCRHDVFEYDEPRCSQGKWKINLFQYYIKHVNQCRTKILDLVKETLASIFWTNSRCLQFCDPSGRKQAFACNYTVGDGHLRPSETPAPHTQAALGQLCTLNIH